MRTAKKSLKKPTKTKPTTKKPPKKPSKPTPRTTKFPNKVARRQNNKARVARYKKDNNQRNKVPAKPLIIKKDVATRKPVVLKSNKKLKLNATDREVITQEVVKRVVSVMQRMLNKSQMINNQLLNVLPSPKALQNRSNDKKRRAPKKYKTPTKRRYSKFVPPKNTQQKAKPNAVKVKRAPNKPANSVKRGRRQKRDNDGTVIGLDSLDNVSKIGMYG
jgi:hypothetical protein